MDLFLRRFMKYSTGMLKDHTWKVVRMVWTLDFNLTIFPLNVELKVILDSCVQYMARIRIVFKFAN